MKMHVLLLFGLTACSESSPPSSVVDGSSDAGTEVGGACYECFGTVECVDGAVVEHSPGVPVACSRCEGSTTVVTPCARGCRDDVRFDYGKPARELCKPAQTGDACEASVECTPSVVPLVCGEAGTCQWADAAFD